MRDYSFGNFISALRERSGLSQYQLGALVGVTDKAVSKWENGVSKPRIDTIRKLAEILDVGVDELLTCEYATFNEERKDLFAMKNDIISEAKKRLHELYGDNPHVRIVNRFKTEALMLGQQEMLLWIGFFGKVQEEFYRKNEYFDVRGANIGASLLAWLLGGTNVNPIPAHYYCPICKTVEFVADIKYGIDLPDKMCSCGNRYHKDGFGIDAVNMYPFFKWNEIHVLSGKTEMVRKCLQEYFKGYGVIREVEVDYSGIEVISGDECKITKFGLFSEEMSKRYPEEIIILRPEEYSKLLNTVSVLTVVEDEEEQMNMQDLQDAEITAQHIEAYFNYAVQKGKFNDVRNHVNLDKVLSNIKSPRFCDLVTLYGFMYGTGVWEDNAEHLYDRGIPLEEMISCREDVYDYLYAKLSSRCCDNPSGLVYEIKEAVRKGKYTNYRMPTDVENLLLECEVPEWYIESIKKILYLFPKTHIISKLKKEICVYTKIGNL